MLLLDEIRRRWPDTSLKVFIDASLPEQVEDREALEKAVREKVVMKVPARTVADGFFLQVVKEKKALLISNDTFKDWKQRDPWIEENIDFLRIGVVFDVEGVLFDPKIDELLKD